MRVQSSASLSITRALKQNSIRNNFNFSNDRLHQIFPKTISPKIFPGIFLKNIFGIFFKFFPGLSQKIFPAFATKVRFAIFQKCRIAPFTRIPASAPYLIQPTLNPCPYQPYSLLSPIMTVSQSGFNMGSDWVLTGRIRAHFGLRSQKSSKNRYFRNLTILNGSNRAGSVGKSFLKRANVALQN